MSRTPTEYVIKVGARKSRGYICRTWDDVLAVLSDLEPGHHIIEIEEYEVAG